MMNKRLENIAELLEEVREWNREWDEWKPGNGTSPKNITKFIQHLSKKWEVKKNEK